MQTGDSIKMWNPNLIFFWDMLEWLQKHVFAACHFNKNQTTPPDQSEEKKNNKKTQTQTLKDKKE